MSPTSWVLVSPSRTRMQPAAAAAALRSPPSVSTRSDSDRIRTSLFETTLTRPDTSVSGRICLCEYDRLPACRVRSSTVRDAMKIIQAGTEEHINQERTLFREYETWLNLDLCFQNFEKELAELPGAYAPPTGRLLLAFENEELAGCVASRKLS